MKSGKFVGTAVFAFAITGIGCSSDSGGGGAKGGSDAGSSTQGGATGTASSVISSSSASSAGQSAAGSSSSKGGAGAGGSSAGGVSETSSATAGRSGPGGTTGGQSATGGTTATAGRSSTSTAVGGTGSPGGTKTGGTTSTGGTGTAGVTSVGGSAGNAGGTFTGTKTPGAAQTGDITVNPGKTFQVVDGFGLADVWQNSSSTTMQTLLWDPVNGIGLNLLRIGIESKSGTSVLMGNAGVADGQACVKFSGKDCKIWAAPWSPPASMKNNNNVNGSGNNSCANTDDTLKTGSYDAWATLLAAFPAYYKQQGGPDLFAISAQNEPDWNPNYEACCYNKTEMVNFIKVLGPKLAALNPPLKVLAAEPDNWSNLWGGDSYGPAIIADATASSFVNIIATHDYGTTSAGTYARPAPPANNTHHLWETECTPNGTGPINIANMIYAAFTTGGMNGWHYWWTQAFIPNASSPPPQYYALGNFSKFVKAGYFRAEVTGAAKASGSVPLVIPFTSTSDGTVVIVVVNGGSAQQVSFFVAGAGWPASVTPYVTTASSKLAAGTAISLTAGRFSASLEAQSVTTFVGKQ
jgi:glucuronoarabinoxylan endo-1,4-beta-xylanase